MNNTQKDFTMRSKNGETWSIQEERLLPTQDKNSDEYKKLRFKKDLIWIDSNEQQGLSPDYLDRLNIRYVSIKKEGFPKESGFYLVILENDFKVKCVCWYTKDLEHWSKGKKVDTELKQEMVTHYLYEELKEIE